VVGWISAEDSDAENPGVNTLTRRTCPSAGAHPRKTLDFRFGQLVVSGSGSSARGGRDAFHRSGYERGKIDEADAAPKPREDE
jgi:hypothetical protein